MSWQATKWAIEQALPTGPKFVLVCLAYHADKHGHEARPGTKLLAQETGLGERSVQVHIKSLLRSGMITVTAYPQGGRGRTVYSLAIPLDSEGVPPESEGVTPAIFAPLQNTETPATFDVTPPQLSTPTPATFDAHKEVLTVPEPSSEPSPGKSGPKRVTKITSEYIEAMVAKFTPRMGNNERRVRTEITDAMNHKAMGKRTDKRQYLNVWLNRAADRWDTQNGSGRPHRASPPADRAAYEGRRW